VEGRPRPDAVVLASVRKSRRGAVPTGEYHRPRHIRV